MKALLVLLGVYLLLGIYLSYRVALDDGWYDKYQFRRLRRELADSFFTVYGWVGSALAGPAAVAYLLLTRQVTWAQLWGHGEGVQTHYGVEDQIQIRPALDPMPWRNKTA